MKKHNPYPSLLSKNSLSSYLEVVYASLEGIPAWGFTRPSKIDLTPSDFEARSKYLTKGYVEMWPSTVGLRQAVWLYAHGSLSALCNEEQAFYLGLAFTALRRPNASWPLTGWNSDFLLVKANLSQEPLPKPYSAGGYYISSIYRASKELNPANPQASLTNGWLWKVDRSELDELSKAGILKAYLDCDISSEVEDFLSSTGAKPCPWQAIALLGFTTGIPFSRLAAGTWMTQQGKRNLYEWLMKVFPEGGYDIDMLKKQVDFTTTTLDLSITQRPLRINKRDWTGSRFNKPTKVKTSKRLTALEEVKLEDLFSIESVQVEEVKLPETATSIEEPVAQPKLSIFDLLSVQDEEDED